MKAEEVANYLKQHPEFFEDYAEALAEIYIAHPHGGRAISISERQILTLRDRSKQLESKLREVIQFGEENDAISEKVHRLAIGLISVESFQALVHLLRFHLRDDFAVPHVALRLWAKPEGVGDLPEYAAVSEELRVFADTLTHPYCGSTSGFGTTAWFGEQAAHIRSQALIALCDGGQTIGMLALGSEDTQRFYADMGILYLERMGEMVSAALVRVAKPAP